MARKLGTYPLSSNIEIEAGAPLDARTIVPLKADLTRAGSFSYPYVGMEVFVTEELQKYRLIGTNPELTDNWTKTDKGVVDGYYDAEHGGFYKDQGFTKPITGTSEVLYIDKSTDNVYRWNGSAFVQINPIDSQVPTIDMADERENIAQNDDVATIMGKIAKYFDDLGEVAFSDDYDDLDNTPTKLSEFENDPGYITDEGIVTSVKVGNTSYDPVEGVVSLPQYPDISGKADKATTLAGYGITDAKIANGTITLGANTITPVTDISGKADKATTLAGYGITDAKIANGTITLGSNTITPLTQHQDISGKADKATTLAGYGITDAKIANGTITLGSNSITPVTDVSGKADKATTLAGYGITDAKIASGTITLGSNSITPITDVSGKADKATTLAGYGITDAKIASGTITLGSNSITPLTSHQTVTNKGATLAWSTAVTVATIGSTDIKVSLPANPNTNTTYTFAGGTNKFTVTPSGGTAQDITITPSIANNITGSGTSGYLAKFNGTNTITSGPQLGSSTTTYLRNDGSWATPPDNNTTYTIATGDGNGQIKVTPSSGSAYNVSVKGLGSRAYDSTEYIPKLTYEYNKEISFGSTGKLLIGKFPCYDSNVTIEINATTSITYHATAVLATQNINNSHGGTIKWDVYGDEADTIAPNLYLYYPNNSRYIEIYFSPASWSKNLIHIRCVALSAAPTNICENVSEIPSTATTKPTNMYKAGSVNYATSAGSVAWSNVSSKPTTIAGYGITDAKIANGVITLGSNTITPLTQHQDISGKADKSATVSTVTWSSNKLTKTINGTTTDVVTAATILGNLTKAQVTTALGYTPPTSDTNNAVTQTATTVNTYTHYEVLLSGTNDNTTRTEQARKTNRLTFDPYMAMLTIGESKSSSGNGMNGRIYLRQFGSTAQWSITPTAGGEDGETYSITLPLEEGTVLVQTALGEAHLYDSTGLANSTKIPTGADVMSYCPIYNDSASKTVYEIPLSSLGLRKSYGPALVAAWKNLFALFYIDSNDNHITKISDCGTGTNLTCTSSYNSSKHTLTLTFNATVWYGITVLCI